MPGSILVIGGTGKTGQRIVHLLNLRGIPVRSATRSPQTHEQVRFEWTDDTSFAGALDGASTVYLVAPPGDPAPLVTMQPFIELALANSVERFVLLSSSMIGSGGPLMGAVHAYLAATAPEWKVLRPSWFMQNFSEQQHRETIRNESRIYSATGDGRTAFIDAADIAAVAVHALTDPKPVSGDLVLTGPEPLSYDDVARHISKAAGRTIVHHRLSAQDLADRFAATGMPVEFAQALAAMDGAIAKGVEDRVSPSVFATTGQQPTRFENFARSAAPAWAPQNGGIPMITRRCRE